MKFLTPLALQAGEAAARAASGSASLASAVVAEASARPVQRWPAGRRREQEGGKGITGKTSGLGKAQHICWAFQKQVQGQEV